MRPRSPKARVPAILEVIGGAERPAPNFALAASAKDLRLAGEVAAAAGFDLPVGVLWFQFAVDWSVPAIRTVEFSDGQTQSGVLTHRCPGKQSVIL